LAEIREFIRIANEGGVAELEVWHGKTRVRIRPRAASSLLSSVQPPATHQVESVPLPPTEETLVRSPIAGIYRDALAPGAEPLIKSGITCSPAGFSV
jgi:hypothetical protein